MDTIHFWHYKLLLILSQKHFVTCFHFHFLKCWSVSLYKLVVTLIIQCITTIYDTLFSTYLYCQITETLLPLSNFNWIIKCCLFESSLIFTFSHFVLFLPGTWNIVNMTLYTETIQALPFLFGYFLNWVSWQIVPPSLQTGPVCGSSLNTSWVPCSQQSLSQRCLESTVVSGVIWLRCSLQGPSCYLKEGNKGEKVEQKLGTSRYLLST